MEAEEIYMNQARMQAAAAFKDKQRGAPANKGVDDPDYENITLTFRNQNQSKGSHSPPKNQVPVRSRPSLDSTRTPRWLYGATISLYILLALFCIILLAWVLMKHSEMSGELLGLKMDLLNAINQIKTQLQDISKMLQKMSNELSTPQ
uniref:Mast cell expressed membrane protein 1 n=1 Tax=Rousettus aegyptiacus TaxID=9407 RepID=A0A7J8BTH7_ROUAE|nr:mast cell expressed membrane protein 1 [Rousettus aegyptiacus]